MGTGAETSKYKKMFSRRLTLPPHGQSVQGHSDAHPKAKAECTVRLCYVPTVSVTTASLTCQ